MRGKWSKGGLVKKTSTPNNFFVVGVTDSTTIFDYGKFLTVEEAKEIADKNASKDLTCYVYSADNEVIYSTER